MKDGFVKIIGNVAKQEDLSFYVRNDTWDHFLDFFLNAPEQNTCFIPGVDKDGDPLFVDMNKLVAFYAISDDKTTKKKVQKTPKAGKPKAM